jgi:hypothetical protein
VEEQFTLAQFNQALIKFRDFGSRLCSADFTDFATQLHIFMDFCENDPIFRTLTVNLKGRVPESAVTEWFDKHSNQRGLVRLALPVQAADRLALLYGMLLRLSLERHDPARVLHGLFRHERQVSASIRNFNDKFTRAFIADLGYELEDLRERLENTAQDARFSSSSLVIFAERGAIVATQGSAINTGTNAGALQAIIGSNVCQLNETVAPEIGLVLSTIMEQIRTETSITSEERAYCNRDVKCIAEELQLKNPRESVVMERIRNLASCAALTVHTTALMDKINQTFGMAIPAITSLLS